MRSLHLLASAALLSVAVGAHADNSAKLVQTGNDNDATVDQTGLLNEATIRQNGTANSGSIFQGVIAEENVASIVQIGSNSASIYQGDETRFSSASVYQQGTGNRAEVEQHWYTNELQISSIVDNNSISATQNGFARAEARQIGNGNSLVMTQDGIYHGNWTAVYQVGDENRASIEQGDGSDIQLAQNGNLNTATISQYNLFGEVEFNQAGDDNLLTVEQSGRSNAFRGSSTGNGNSVELVQWFDGNQASVVQSGDDNIAAINQLAGYNEARINQVGMANQASITQNAELMNAVISQTGTGNMATVTQQ